MAKSATLTITDGQIRTSINALLKDLLSKVRSLPNVEAVVVVSRGGLVIASETASRVHEETFSAMCATMAGAATAAVAEFGKGEPEKIVVDTESGSLLVMDAGTKALLATMMESREGVGKVVQTMNEIRPEITELVR